LETRRKHWPSRASCPLSPATLHGCHGQQSSPVSSLSPPSNGKDIQERTAEEAACTHTERSFPRRWTWRQSDRATSTAETRNALLTIEGVNGITLSAIEAAMEELVSLVRQYCGGEVPWSLVDRDFPWAVME
jgi:hypothetical protein